MDARVLVAADMPTDDAVGGDAGVAAPAHRPVMAAECLAALAPGARADEGGVFVDATFGRGGHTRLLLAAAGPRARVLAFDQDPEAAAEAATVDDPRFTFVRANFSRLAAELERLGVAAVDGVLFDLGVSSPQLDTAARGFSFLRDGPLDMRMDPTRGEPVSAWLARAPEAEIADVLYTLGEERASRRLARAIVHDRKTEPYTRTGALAAMVGRVIGGPRGRIHPATRTFQALRMHVNDELGVLDAGLGQALDRLAPGGAVAVLSFHSLEDRLVKNRLRREAGQGPGEDDGLPPGLAGFPPPRAHRLERPRRAFPSEAEQATNPRARSAVLRWARRRGAEAATESLDTDADSSPPEPRA